jgi:hypothetical protein
VTASGWAARPPKSWSDPNANSPAWKAFRKRWLAEHPYCIGPGPGEPCQYPGAPGYTPDHKDGVDYQVDRCNPDAIRGTCCKGCHQIRTTRQGNAARRRKQQGGTPYTGPSRQW